MLKKTLLVVIVIITASLNAQTLMSWEFNGFAGNETTGTATTFAANISNVSPSGVISRGAGISPATNANRYNANNWGMSDLTNAVTNNKYMTFTITPATSYKMTLTGLRFNLERSSTGPNAFTFRSSYDNYSTNLGSISYTTTPSPGLQFNVALSGLTDITTAVTFRMYGYGATGSSGSAGFEGTGADLEILGTVAPNFGNPVITTLAATDITHYGCASGGNISSDGGADIQSCGIVIGRAENPTVGGEGIIQVIGDIYSTGVFNVQAEGLAPGTLYYIRAYAINAAGTGYGDNVSFTTAVFPAPNLLTPVSVTNSSFKARWQPVINAQYYKLDVASAPVFSDGSNTNLVQEAFDGGITPPTGWTFNGITSIYDSQYYYGNASPSLRFDNTGDYVITPSLSNPTTISFWVRGAGTSGASVFSIQQYYGGTWNTVADLTVGGTSPYNLPTSGVTKTFSLNSSASKIRFYYTKDIGNVGLDDVIISNYIAPTYVSGYQNRTVYGTEQSVTGLTASTTYYYRVRAFSTTNDLSANSVTDSVLVLFGGTVENPVGLTASSINSSTVSLSWQKNSAHDDVMIAYSTSNSFGTPSGTYTSGASIPGGGTVLYKGSSTLCTHNGATPNTTYYYRAWSVDLENHYSSPINTSIHTQIGSSERIKVHFIDVKQGDCALIQRGSHNYMIDSGKDLSTNKIVTYLQEQGVTNLDACLITHPDFDHYGEFEDLLESGTVTVGKFIKNNDNSTSLSWNSLMNLISSMNIPLEIVNSSNALNWALDTQILNPQPTRSENDNSIVFKMIYGNISFLFTGDMEVATNNYITSNYDVDIDVLKVSHHGSINGTTQTFLNEATPAISVICAGNNSFGHPSYTVNNMLQSIGSLIYSTADDWNTWTGSGSSDDTTDDDVVLETDGSNIWKNGELVWTKPSLSISTPQNLALQISGTTIQLSWDTVTNASSYHVFANSSSPSATYSDCTSEGDFEVVSNRIIWSVPLNINNLRKFYYVTAVN